MNMFTCPYCGSGFTYEDSFERHKAACPKRPPGKRVRIGICEVEDGLCMTHGFSVSPRVKCPRSPLAYGVWERSYREAFGSEEEAGITEAVGGTSVCWVCGEHFSDDSAPYCEVCGALKCSGGHCLCSLGEQARVAVEREIESMGMWEHHGGKRRKKRRR